MAPCPFTMTYRPVENPKLTSVTGTRDGAGRGILFFLRACLPLLICIAGSVMADEPATSGAGLVPLRLNLPAPVFAGTPKEAPHGVDVEPTPDKPPPPLMVPPDVKNLAPAGKISCSDHGASASALAKITDGNKRADEDAIVLLRKGLQWVQFDLGATREIFAVVFWHAHDIPKVY